MSVQRGESAPSSGAAAPAALASAHSGSTAASEPQHEPQQHHDRPYSTEHGLSREQVERYSRHLLLPSFGVAGQGRLCAGSVLVVGCGGLGSPAALYLAAAGIGVLGLVDHDVVELSNMHRQVIHMEARLGQHKAASAAAAIAALNSSVSVRTHTCGLRPSNAVDIISGYDCVIDASDNPPTRYLINDACVACGVPLVSAAAVGTDGQLTVYNHGPSGPCYRCLFPECPPAANCSRCADAGVLGPVPGVMGVLQALEAVKLLSGAGQVLAGRLLLFDGLAGRFTTIQLRGRAPGCAACAPGAALTRDSIAAYDYAAFTHGQQPSDGPPTPLQVLPAQQRITPSQLQELITPPQQPKQQQQQQPGGTCPAGACGASGSGERLLLLDVRPPEQFHIMALPGAVNVPFLKLEQRLPEVLQLCGAPEPAPQQQQQQQPEQLGDTPAATPAARVAADSQQCRVVVMCRRGNHSQLAVARLRELGVAAVDVAGGYEAWAAEVDAAMPVL